MSESTRNHCECTSKFFYCAACCSECWKSFCDYVWLFVRLVYTFTAAEAAVVALVVLIDVALQIMYRMLLPGVDNIPEGVDPGLVTAASLFFLFFFLPPCLFDLAPAVARFVKDSWVDDEMPRFLVACKYIWLGRDRDTLATTLQDTYGKLNEEDKATGLCPSCDTWTTLWREISRRNFCTKRRLLCLGGHLVQRHQTPRIFKGLLVIVMVLAFVIYSLICGLFAGIQLFFKIGLYVQLLLLPLWLLIVLVGVKVSAILVKKHLVYSIWDKDQAIHNKYAISLYFLVLVTWIITLSLFIASMNQTGSSGGVIAGFVVIHILCGLWSVVIFFGRIEISEAVKTKEPGDTKRTKTVDETEVATENLDDLNGTKTEQRGVANPKLGDAQASDQEEKQRTKTKGMEEICLDDLNGTKTEQKRVTDPKRGDTRASDQEKHRMTKEMEETCLASLLAEPLPKWCRLRRFFQFCGVFVLVVTLSISVLFDVADNVYSSRSDCVIPTSSQRKRSVTDMAMHDICSKTWNNLNIVDLAILAKAAYQNDKPDASGKAQNCGVGVKIYLDMKFPTSDWTVVNKSKRADGAVFYELKSKDFDVTVIAIRGTDGKVDALQSVDFWSEAALFQLFSTVIPLTSILPDETFRDLVCLASSSEMALDAPGRRYFTGLEKYIESRLNGPNKLDKERVLITGHSLGGGLSKMAGARFGIRSFSFNGPGLIYSRGKVGDNGVDVEDINRSAVNIVLQGDVVSLIDRLGGSIHRLKCHDGSFSTCHKIDTIMEELRTQCRME